jgi:hypothetical protein
MVDKFSDAVFPNQLGLQVPVVIILSSTHDRDPVLELERHVASAPLVSNRVASTGVQEFMENLSPMLLFAVALACRPA